jgi:hypothetical protein
MARIAVPEILAMIGLLLIGIACYLAVGLAATLLYSGAVLVLLAVGLATAAELRGRSDA